MSADLAVVTGALGNLGPVWCDALAGAGYDVVRIDVRGGDGVESADVTDRAALTAILERVGTPAVLVNNAGIDQPPGEGGELPPDDDFLRVLDVNTRGTYVAAHVFGTAMQRAGVTVCTLVQTNQVVCALGSLDPGKSKTVFLTVLVGPSVPTGTTLHNSVTVTSDTPDPDGSNNTATADTTVHTSADLWLDKQGTQRSGNPAPVVTYTLVVHNDAGCESDAQSTPTPNCGSGGPSDAQNITVVDTLPLDPKKLVVQFVSPQCTYSKATHKVTCTAATVPVGASVTFVIEAQVQGSVGNILNTATVSSSTPDPVTGNNTNAVTLVIKGGTGKKK